MVFCLLLVLPGWALSRLAPEGGAWRWVLTVATAVSLAALWAYRVDKRRAQIGGWRIPESTLHLFELAGGWPGAFLAQRALRHKNAKRSYQVVFWAIVLVYQLIALDFVLEWRLTRSLRDALG